MTSNYAQLSYRKSAIQGASTIGLVIALYDTLSGDLRRAAAAIRSHDIQKRCTEVNHAFLVLGQLEDWVETKSDEKLAKSLSGFYSYLRARMMEASLRQSAQLLEDQVGLILQVRAAWQQKDSVQVADDELTNQPTPADIDEPSASIGKRNMFSRSA
jgi:flagellar protein FliS